MKKNILHKLSELFSSSHQSGEKQSEQNFLYNHRLRRTEAAFYNAKNLKNAGSKFFLAILVLCMAALPFSKALAAAFVTLDAFSGHPTTLHVSGGGWTSGETVSLFERTS